MNITEKAMLVSLSIKQWTGRKYDRQITEEVNANHNSKDAGRFNKLLLEKTRLNPIQRAANNIRIFHYENTLAWADEGDRLLPVANFFEYSTKINELKSQFETAVEDFLEDYPLFIKEAQIKLNGLFNPMDYPSNIRNKFAVRFSFMPVPDSKDFRVTLSEEQIDEMKKQINVEVGTRLDNATQSLRSKIKEQLMYTRDRLNSPNGIFRDSLFDNIKSLVELTPKLNITSDPSIIGMVDEMQNLLVNPQDVRDNKALRTEVVERINSILAM